MEDTRERVKKVINNTVENLEVEINDDTSLIELNINSLIFIKIMIQVEEEFNIQLENSILSNKEVTTFGELISLLEPIINKEGNEENEI